MRLSNVAPLLLILSGFTLRLHYLTTSHPFFDEYTTVLASRRVLQTGWPLLPSGLFYEHGLLATYLITPFTALFVNTPIDRWQPAHWGLMLSRWPSLLLGTLTIPLIYTLGRRLLMTGHRASIALLAAGLFALSPEGVVWGGRARMYALATLLVLLTVSLAYRGTIYPAPARLRWLSLVCLLAALLTQFGVLILVPPLIVGMLVSGWLSWKIAGELARPWFLRGSILWEGAGLAAVIALAVLVKRLGRPLGAAALGHAGSGVGSELVNAVAYQTTFYFTWSDTLKFLARQFGVPHHFWLVVAALIGTLLGLGLWSWARLTAGRVTPNYFPLYLWLVFGLIIVEMVTVLEPFRRNPRYLVMYLPLFYLIAAVALFNFKPLLQPFAPRVLRATPTIITLLFLTLLTAIGFNDLRLVLVTPEPAYEAAFAKVQADWQPDDRLLTMNTPAAGLYRGRADGFTVQIDADQFLLDSESGPVDRWLGAPWLGTVAAFNLALNRGPRTWFVIDTIRQPVYFRGDWQAVLNTQMEQIWAKDNALVYRTRPDRIPLPGRPAVSLEANFEDTVLLSGYTLNPASFEPRPTTLTLTLFWQPLTDPSLDYTTFVHLRSEQGQIMAQSDRQPLDGSYPTSHWRAGETVIDPMPLPLPPDLPSGRYFIYVGLYRVDTLTRLPLIDDGSGENAVRLGEVILP